ncbi:MAG: alpha/beta hydrolase family protein [Bryobacteraceae bacterium]
MDLLERKTPHGTSIQYASGDLQFGELRLPSGSGPHPVVMFIHGGCWMSKLPSLPVEATSLDLLRPMTAALAAAGIATWNVEYRRIGNPGGGWPGSLDDIRAAAAHLLKLSRTHNLDLERAVVAGHSSGGHLALWIAAESKSPSFRAAVNLDGPSDLKSARAHERKICGTAAITNFVGGSPEDKPERYEQLAAWPAGKVEFVGGSLLRGMPDQVKLARERNANMTELPEAGHFDMLAPQSPQWQAVLEIFESLMQ